MFHLNVVSLVLATYLSLLQVSIRVPKISKEIFTASMQDITNVTQPAFTCSKLTVETLEQGVKYVQS